MYQLIFYLNANTPLVSVIYLNVNRLLVCILQWYTTRHGLEKRSRMVWLLTSVNCDHWAIMIYTFHISNLKLWGRGRSIRHICYYYVMSCSMMFSCGTTPLRVVYIVFGMKVKIRAPSKLQLLRLLSFLYMKHQEQQDKTLWVSFLKTMSYMYWHWWKHEFYAWCGGWELFVYYQCLI